MRRSPAVLCALLPLTTLGPPTQAGSAATTATTAERLVVGTKQAEPFAIKQPDGTWSGIAVELWREIAVELDLTTKGYSTIPAYLSKGRKSFLKSDLFALSERELKKIALLSPEATMNFIDDGKVVDKFVYLLCRNSNCVTRYIHEDVPPKFYNDNGTIRCRYCRKPYLITNKKVSESEKKEFIDSLSKEIEVI